MRTIALIMIWACIGMMGTKIVNELEGINTSIQTCRGAALARHGGV